MGGGKTWEVGRPGRWGGLGGRPTRDNNYKCKWEKALPSVISPPPTHTPQEQLSCAALRTTGSRLHYSFSVITLYVCHASLALFP